jgi:hypothetical protein
MPPARPGRALNCPGGPGLGRARPAARRGETRRDGTKYIAVTHDRHAVAGKRGSVPGADLKADACSVEVDFGWRNVKGSSRKVVEARRPSRSW